MWSSAPVSRVLIPFVCGIIACIFLEIYMITIPAILFVGFAIPFVGLHIFSAKINYKFLWLGGVFMSLSLVALGGLIVGMNKLDTRPDFFANALEKKDFVEVKISEPLVEKEKTWKGIGDVKKWNNVYHNAFLSPADWIFTGVNEGKAFYKFIYGTRQKFTESFTKYVGGEDEQGLVRALVLGDETDISKELISSYAGTGTLHVLSVSGLHVGLIFIVLSFIFKFLKRGKFGNQIFVLLMLIILWGYAFLTGMSPSVARSVVMFSFVLIGMAFQRQNNIFNSICISALVLLVDDPFLIARTSFQLSYVALLGIVSLHPHIYKWVEIPEKEKRKWFTKWWAIDWVWSVVAVSLSAQLATMPLALFYFNAFPTWFILGNLIIIPWSSLVLLAGALFLVLSLFLPSAILAFFGKILFYLIHGLNTTVEGMDNLPFA
ncbi:MAG: ComEC/Rec2 family competence protein, partial [Bacteroidetes bacterium]|nr:ComEC/Rec2 family competence protein [Bacteroidota bacterium]